MIELLRIESHGSRQGRSTRWQRIPGYVEAHLTNGGVRRFPEGTLTVAVFAALRADGISTDAFEARRREAEKAIGYPDKPTGVELYQYHYGYEKPISLGEWCWSSTFGRWARIVTFADGWTGVTYPKPA